VLEVHYGQSADCQSGASSLHDGSADALVQNFGSSHDVLIQVPLKQDLAGAKLSEQVLETLRKQDASVDMRRVEFVGPQVGKDLVANGALALLLVSWVSSVIFGCASNGIRAVRHHRQPA